MQERGPKELSFNLTDFELSMGYSSGDVQWLGREISGAQEKDLNRGFSIEVVIEVMSEEGRVCLGLGEVEVSYICLTWSRIISPSESRDLPPGVSFHLVGRGNLPRCSCLTIAGLLPGKYQAVWPLPSLAFPSPGD